MKFVQYQDCISPHQMPLAREIARHVGAENFRYLYLDKSQENRVKMGWKMDGDEPWLFHIGSDPTAAEQALNECDVILIGYRDIDLIERMVVAGKRVFVQGERWFKDVYLSRFLKLSCFDNWMISGKIRMVVPDYRRMAKRFIKLTEQNKNLTVLPIGVHAWNDMKWLGVPENKMMLWGYFVEPSKEKKEKEKVSNELKILFVGRLIKLKHCDTVINATIIASKQQKDKSIKLTIVGDGPEKEKLSRIVNSDKIEATFLSSQPINEIRKLMRNHDVLVFASDARDGWGAVVSEALEENMIVFGTYETGAAATILPKNNLFHAGDSDALAGLLIKAAKNDILYRGIGEWSAAKAAERLLKIV